MRQGDVSWSAQESEEIITCEPSFKNLVVEKNEYDWSKIDMRKCRDDVI
jgi:hypothetical protein